MNIKIHHVALTVTDLEKSIKWYQEKLGFTVVTHFKRPARDTVLLQRDTARIELFGIHKGLKPLPKYREDLYEDISVVGTKHVCLEVDDLDATVAQLKAKGVDFVMDADNASFGGRFIFFKDCNGILIELYQA
jgi:methylmalonyl-CoA/ethylmalonyl-CoA epimerase